MKGNLGFVFGFVFVAMTFIIIFLLVNPMLLKLNVEVSSAGQDIVEGINISIADSSIMSYMNESVLSAQEGLGHSSNIISYSIKYAWLLFLIVVAILTFIVSRSFVETGQTGRGGRTF